MAGLSQRVPNYILGISEQPDELKLPGQVTNLVNAVPDISRGCLKRPGSYLVDAITPLTASTGKWFHIYTNEVNQHPGFIGQITTDGKVKIWRTSDGVEIPVDYTGMSSTNDHADYLEHSAADEIQPLTINETTFVCNRGNTTTPRNVAMLTGASDKSPAVVHEAYIELKQIAYGKQYALDIYDPTNNTTTTFTRATAIAAREGVTTSGASGYTNDGACSLAGREIVNGSASGKTNLRYEMEVRCTPVPESGGTTNPNYDDSYQTYAKLQFGGEGWTTGDTHSHTSEKGLGTVVEVTKHITVTTRANLARVRPQPTASTADESVTADGILGDLKAAIDAISGHGITATIVGNGIHLKRSSAFNVSTPEDQLMSVVTQEINDISRLPKACRNGYILKVVNSASDADDYFLKFNSDNFDPTASGDQFGVGAWEETVAPDLEIKFDPDTMPIKIQRELPGNTHTNGRFLVRKIDWIDRQVGDDITNPKPSFVGQPINKILFFRNRLVLLSEENVIVSRQNDFFNFFAKTALTVSPVDPVDIQASSTYPHVLFDGIETNTGLILFSSNQQFMLTTDSDAFGPETAKVNNLASYNFDSKTNPVTLGTTVGFLNNAGSNSRFFEMADARREGEPTVLEQSKLISKLLPADISMVAPSKENNLVLFGSEGSNEVWGYSYYNTTDKRIQSAWFKWTLSGTLVYHCLLEDAYTFVTKNGSNYTLETIDVKTDTDTIESTDGFRVYSDCHKEIATSAMTYTASTNKTTFTLPTGMNSSRDLVVIVMVSGDNAGLSDKPTLTGSTVSLTGDWTSSKLVIGYEYEWLVKLPTIYSVRAVGDKIRSDTSSSLIIHRTRFNFGDVGTIDVTLERPGKTNYTSKFTSNIANTMLASRFNIDGEEIFTVPCYEKNTNIDITLKSTHPTPVALHSMTWEGDYAPKFYRRA